MENNHHFSWEKFTKKMVIFNSYVSLPEGMANAWEMSKEFLFLSCLFDKTTLSLTCPKGSNCIPHDAHFINVNLPLTAMNSMLPMKLWFPWFPHGTSGSRASLRCPDSKCQITQIHIQPGF